MASFMRRQLQWGLCCSILLLVSVVSLWHYQKDGLRGPSSAVVVQEDVLAAVQRLATIPEKRTNIVIASWFNFHFEVYLALAWTLRRVMSHNVQLQVYAEQPFGFGFQDVVDNWGIYPGEVKDRNNLIADIKKNIDIDMVVLGTCEIDMRDHGTQLLAAWEARDAQHKFKLVCIVHNAVDYFWQSAITEWSRRDAIRFLTIAPHVAQTFRKRFQQNATSPDPIVYTAGYEDIPIDVHPHILDAPNLTDLPPNRTLSNVVIQGYLDGSRRDYGGIFKDLLDSLRDDPSSWGYLPLGSNPSYLHDPSHDAPPLKIHLVGSGELEVPPELRNVVILHKDLKSMEFYRLLGSMDVCVPAFSHYKGYFDSQGSSTAMTCMEVNVPIMLTQRMRDTYTFLDNPRISITRPSALREIHALHALRTRDVSRLLASDPAHSGIALGAHPRIRRGIEEMMRHGWVRPKAGFDAAKHRVWRENDVVGLRLLRDM